MLIILSFLAVVGWASCACLMCWVARLKSAAESEARKLHKRTEAEARAVSDLVETEETLRQVRRILTDVNERNDKLEARAIEAARLLRQGD
jgi:hypothetical protein